MLVYFFFSCVTSETPPALPESRLPSNTIIQAVQYGSLRGLIHKPSPVPSSAVIYVVPAPLSAYKDCFSDLVSNKEVSFLTTNEQLTLATQYVAGFIPSDAIQSQTIECL